MTASINVSGKIFGALLKAKEIIENEFEDVNNWITDILENENRSKQNECEICQSQKKLELHHIRGRKHGNEVITVCHDCHKILSDKQRLWDKSWLKIESDDKDSFLKRGLIDVCYLKYERTGIEIYKRFAEIMTEGFTYD